MRGGVSSNRKNINEKVNKFDHFRSHGELFIIPHSNRRTFYYGISDEVEN